MSADTMRWVQDFIWAVNMVRARRARRRAGFAARIRFDNAVRPHLKGDWDSATVIAYPDAVYHAKSADFARAHEALSKGNPDL